MNLKKLYDSSFTRLWDVLHNKTFAIHTAYRGFDKEGNKLGQAFSESVMRNGVPFVFDSVERPTSVAGFMWFDKNNLLYFHH